jgi:outer membrane protein OmpA-like peptidoglycan-associated protein
MNQTLSENRAAAVKIIIENGIKADRLNSTGFVKLNQWTLTKLQEKHNRRVEI